jgi:UDP-N-acetyl-D-mannosaminuronic acid dehydrogenase
MIFSKLCVLGLGYIGLPTASTFATNGLQVIGVDINTQVVDALSEGNIHIQEPGLRTIVHAAFRSGNLVVRNEPEPADAFIIAVPTPFYSDKRADMSYVISATQSIVPHLRPGNLVILESTSPPRTTVDLVAPILEKSGLKAGVDFFLAYSPERVLPGQILRELVDNARVIGGITPFSAEAGRDLYSVFVRGQIFVTDSTTAEMVKLLENTYRDVNIAIANEFALLADRFGVDVWEAIKIANHHPRVHILNPGPGVGGHCISVDPWFLVEAAPDITPLIRTARQVNDAQPRFVVDLVMQAAGQDLTGKRIAVLGLAYKADVDDLRESPAIEVIHLLSQSGAIIKAFEPNRPEAVVPGAQTSVSLASALIDAEVILLLVNHSAFRNLDPAAVALLTPARIIVDTVHSWIVTAWQEAGFKVVYLGNGQTD